MQRTVNELLYERYNLARIQCASLPVICDEKEALDRLNDLLSSGMLVRYPHPSKPWYRVYLGQSEPLTLEDHFSWPKGSTTRKFLVPKLLLDTTVLRYLLTSVFDIVIGKLNIDVNNLYGPFKFSLGILWVLKGISWIGISLFGILILRTILFIVTYLTMSSGIWLFPRLLTENSFLGPFYPVFAWDDTPKVSLGLRWKKFKKTMLMDLGVQKPRQRPFDAKGSRPKRFKRIELRPEEHF